jgi:hypothetical protein
MEHVLVSTREAYGMRLQPQPREQRKRHSAPFADVTMIAGLEKLPKADLQSLMRAFFVLFVLC